MDLVEAYNSQMLLDEEYLCDACLTLNEGLCLGRRFVMNQEGVSRRDDY